MNSDRKTLKIFIEFTYSKLWGLFTVCWGIVFQYLFPMPLWFLHPQQNCKHLYHDQTTSHNILHELTDRIYQPQLFLFLFIMDKFASFRLNGIKGWQKAQTPPFSLKTKQAGLQWNTVIESLYHGGWAFFQDRPLLQKSMKKHLVRFSISVKYKKQSLQLNQVWF